MSSQQSRRPWLRRLGVALTTLVVLALAAGLVLQLVARSRLRRATAKLESSLGVTTLAALEKPKLADDQNAARWLQAGGAALNWSEPTRRAVGDLSNSPMSAWSADQAAAARAVVASSRPALDLLQRAASLPGSSFAIPYSQGADARLPNLLELISAGRLLMVEARVAFLDNDPARSVETLRTLGRLAAALEEEPLLITELVGIACERMLLNTVTEALASEAPWADDPAVLDQLQELVPSTDLAAGLRRAFAFEALASSRASRHDQDPLPDSPLAVRLFLRSFRPLVAAETIRLVLRWAELVEVPYCSAPERFTSGSVPSPLALHRQAAFGFTPNLSSAIARTQVVLALRQLVRAGLELRLAAASTGAYPDTDVAAALATRSPLTGQPVTVRREPDGGVVLDLPGAAKQVTDAGIVLGRVILTVDLPAPRQR